MNKNLAIGTEVVYKPSTYHKKFGHVVENPGTGRIRVKWYKETWYCPSNGNKGERPETKRTWVRCEALMVVPTIEAELARLLPDA